MGQKFSGPGVLQQRPQQTPLPARSAPHHTKGSVPHQDRQRGEEAEVSPGSRGWRGQPLAGCCCPLAGTGTLCPVSRASTAGGGGGSSTRRSCPAAEKLRLSVCSEDRGAGAPHQPWDPQMMNSNSGKAGACEDAIHPNTCSQGQRQVSSTGNVQVWGRLPAPWALPSPAGWWWSSGGSLAGRAADGGHQAPGSWGERAAPADGPGPAEARGERGPVHGLPRRLWARGCPWVVVLQAGVVGALESTCPWPPLTWGSVGARRGPVPRGRGHGEGAAAQGSAQEAAAPSLPRDRGAGLHPARLLLPTASS